MTRRATFIGRWQPPHKGHDWLIRQALDRGEPVQILVRCTPPDEANPLDGWEVGALLEEAYKDEDVVVLMIDDVSTVYYGRDVGYGVEELTPPADISGISATQIRQAIVDGDESWKDKVLPGIADMIEEMLA